jgi:hypothetical protein
MTEPATKKEGIIINIVKKGFIFAKLVSNRQITPPRIKKSPCAKFNSPQTP